MKKRKMFIKFKDASVKVGDYIDKKGFYIVILLCIVVIGATIAIVSIRDYKKIGSDYVMDDKLIDENVSTQAAVESGINTGNKDISAAALTLPQQPAVNKAEKTQQEAEVKKEQVQPANTVTRESTANKPKRNENTQESNSVKKKTVDVEQKQIKLSYPVFGKIINDYAQDKLIYSETLQQWTTHSGIDIASDAGSPVKAAMDGVVKNIKNDPRYGIIIIIEHAGGMKTIYANLSSASMVKPGQKVNAGKVISGVGSTAGFECAEASHLHFEVMKDGKYVNPVNFLPSSK